MKTIINTYSIFLIGITLFVGCKNESTLNKFNNMYQADKKLFRTEIISHFPSNLDSNNVTYQTNVYKLSEKKPETLMPPFYLMLVNKYSQKEYDLLKTNISSTSNKVISPNDTSIMLIFSYFKMEEYSIFEITDYADLNENKILLNHNFRHENEFPLPIFEIDNFKDSTTFTRLSNDFQIYALNAKPGIYFDEKYLLKNECIPNSWEHGFSNGFGLNDKARIIIYWTIVW